MGKTPANSIYRVWRTVGCEEGCASAEWEEGLNGSAVASFAIITFGFFVSSQALFEKLNRSTPTLPKFGLYRYK